MSASPFNNDTKSEQSRMYSKALRIFPFPPRHMHTRHLSGTSVNSVRSDSSTSSDRTTTAAKSEMTIDLTGEDAGMETDQGQTPVPGLTRRSSPRSCSTDSEAGDGAAGSSGIEYGCGNEKVSRGEMGREGQDVALLREGLASFALGPFRTDFKQCQVKYEQLASEHIDPHPTGTHNHPALYPSSTFVQIKHHTRPNHQTQTAKPSGTFSSGSRLIPAIFEHGTRAYVNANKVAEIRARKAVVAANFGSSAGATREAGARAGDSGAGGVGPIRNLGSIRNSQRKTTSMAGIEGRYEVCVGAAGRHVQVSRLVASPYGLAGRPLPTLHFKRSIPLVSDPFRLPSPISIQAGLAAARNGLAGVRFPPLSVPQGATRRQRLPAISTTSGFAADRRLLLIGPAVAQHLEQGGSVRIRDVEGSIVGVLA